MNLKLLFNYLFIPSPLGTIIHHHYTAGSPRAHVRADRNSKPGCHILHTILYWPILYYIMLHSFEIHLWKNNMLKSSSAYEKRDIEKYAYAIHGCVKTRFGAP